MTIFTRQTRFIAIASLFLFVTANLSLWARLLEIYPLDTVFSSNALHFISIGLFFALSIVLFMLWVCHGKIGKWILAAFVFVSSLAAYYMDHYGVVIDVVMINNIFETNPQEMAGLISPSMLLRLFAFGALPLLQIG